MADNPPAGTELADDPAGLDGFDAGETEFWASLMPWDDLLAKSPPARHLAFQRDIIPTLSMMVGARGPSGSRLVPADASGRLMVASAPYFSDLSVAANQWGPLNVRDSSIHSVGEFIYVPNLGPVSSQLSTDFLTRVLAVVKTTIPGQNDTLSVGPTPPSVVPAGTRFLVIPPPDSWLPMAPWKGPTSLPIIGSRAGVGTTALGGAQANQVYYLHSYIVNVQVAAAGATCQIQDSAGNARWEWPATAVATFTGDLKGAPVGAVGTGVTWAVVGGAATAKISLVWGLG